MTSRIPEARPSTSRLAPARKATALPCVLAVGGLDPGGGAGILADARAITRTGAFACAATAMLTVQSTNGLKSAIAVSRADLVAMCNEVLRNQRVLALKIGALGSVENARAVADLLAIHKGIPGVVDTVMLPTRGRARLLDEKAIATLRTRIIPGAALVTVNAPEAEVLTGTRVTRLEEAKEAVVSLLAAGAKAVLLKGGHLGGAQAVDLLGFAGRPRIVELSASRIRLKPTHGGGCVLASLIAGRLAMTNDEWLDDAEQAVTDAVRWAKRIHREALDDVRDVGGDLRVLR